ncbi:MAG TPA: anti-sigma factor [Terriglobales bacterium]|nr:anti-sigma factor [Terriglobales bacterium]
MSGHEQFAEDLALLALGSLGGDERLALEEHLRECAACRRELESLRGDMALLSFSTGGPKPPARSRERLMAAIAREPRGSAAPAKRWWMLAPSLAVAALMLVIVLLMKQNSALRQQVARMDYDAAAQHVELRRAREVVSTLTASDAMRVTLVAAKTPPQPQGKAIYVRDRSNLIFIASNMPAAPPEKAYELWLIPASGAPIPAGVFKPDAHGSATVVNPPLPGGVEAKAFAITIEPEAGSATPTMPIVMVGAGE